MHKKLQGTEEPWFFFSGSHGRVNEWMWEHKQAVALTSFTSQATSSSTLLWFCGLSRHTGHHEVPVIYSVDTVTHTNRMFSQHPALKTSFVACLVSAFWLLVCWKLVWFAFYSCSWSEGCLSSFCSYIKLYVLMVENSRYKQVLGRFKRSFLPEEVLPIVTGTSEKPLTHRRKSPPG